MSDLPDHEPIGDEPGDSVAIEPAPPELTKPPLYSVLLLNDDYTPMEFVIEVLCLFFNMDMEKATQVMLHVHTRGRAVCGIYSREVAEAKVSQVTTFSRVHHHPLLCTMEKS